MDDLEIFDQAGGKLRVTEQDDKLIIGTTEDNTRDEPLVVLDDGQAETLRKWLDDYLMDKSIAENL